MSITYKKMSTYFSLRNKFFRSTGAALLQAVDLTSSPCFSYLGLDGKRQVPEKYFIMKSLEAPRGASENI